MEKKTAKELIVLHKLGDAKATVCLLAYLDKKIRKFSYTNSFNRYIDEDMKSVMTIKTIELLSEFKIEE